MQPRFSRYGNGRGTGTSVQRGTRVSAGTWPAVAALLLAVAGCDVARDVERLGASPLRVVPEAGARDVRGLYVSDASAAANDPASRRRLLDLVAAGRFTHVVLYGLRPFLRGPADVSPLRALIGALREAGVVSVAAPVAGRDRIEALESLATRADGVSFDAWVTEDEWWNGCAARGLAVLSLDVRRGCFSRFEGLVAQMRVSASRLRGRGHDVRLGAYLGYPTRGEAAWLAERLDFVFLDQPGASPVAATRASGERARYRLDRFRWFAEAGTTVWPIFYARGEVPMQPWIDRNGVVSTESAFFESLDADEVLGPLAGAIEGVQYFADDGFTVP